MTRKPNRDRWAEVSGKWQEELSDGSLRELAGSAVFARGQAYFAQGKALLVRDGGGHTTWEVRGTRIYTVELYFEDGGLHVDCTCPYADDEGFCKHMVAAGLAWRAHLGGTTGPEERTPSARPDAAGAAGKSAAAVKRASAASMRRLR